MSENWRRKKYYSKRQMIETSRVLTPQIDSIIVCLSGSELEMLRNLTTLLHWRTTFVSEYHTGYYLCPDNDEWDIVQAIVAELERKLMGGECEELIDAINEQTAVIDVLQQCVCAMVDYQEKIAGRLPELGGYVDNEDVTYLAPGDTLGPYTPPMLNTEKCENAQAIWYYTYQLYTEKLLPFANDTADTLTALAVATVGFGALATFIGIPVAILAALVLGLVAWGIDGSISNFINWMLGNKDEIICILYRYGDNLTAAAAAVRTYVNAAAELSYLDKQVLNAVMASTWHYTWIIKDQQENGTYDAYLVPGQCDDCEVPEPQCVSLVPCNESDWSSSTEDPVCYNGVPRCYPSIGYVRHIGGTLPAPGTNCTLAVQVQGSGGSDPITVDFKVLCDTAPGYMSPTISGTVNPGETKWISGTFTTSLPGEVHYIQCYNSPYYVFLYAYCIGEQE